MAQSTFRVFTGNWHRVRAHGCLNAAQKQANKEGLQEGDSILVKDKKDHNRWYLVGQNQVIRPMGRTDVPA